MLCLYKSSDDRQCRANATKTSAYCFMHDPAMADRQKVAASLGGKSSKKNADPLEAIPVSSMVDVVKLLGHVVNEVREAKIDLRVANCIGYLSGHLVKAIESSAFEDRLKAIEDKLLTIK